MTASLYAIFAASGASALIFETLWFRQAGLAFGNTVWASSLVLSGFMGGLAFGNALAARYGGRFTNPVRIYAIAEVVIALTGVGLVYLLPALGAALAPWLRPLMEHLWILNFFRLLSAFILLLIPSTAMGVTLPLLTKAIIGHDPNFGSVLGRLYGWNTLGAVSGAVAGEAFLLEAIGIHGTAFTAGILNIGAAVVAAWLSTQKPLLLGPPADMGRPALRGAAGRPWLIAIFFSGFCLLALEVVWFRFLLLFVMAHSITFAVMLATVLTGIAFGGLAASQWLRFSPDAHRFGAAIAFAAGLLCVATYAVFPLVLKPFATSSYVLNHPVEILRLGVPLMFPVSFLSGIFFTLVGAAVRHNLASETATTGILTLANTVGAALGSLVGGFVLLPVLGMEKSFFLIALLYGGIGALLMTGSTVPRRIAYASAAVFLISITLFPFGSMEKRFLPVPVKHFFQRTETTGRVAAVREGLTETIIYLETPRLGKPATYTMLTNSYGIAGTEYQYRRYMKLFVYWPMAVHPNLKRALLICYGVGNTAKALTDSKSLETIDVVDISRDVLEMSDIVYPNKTDNPLHDPRVHIHIEDGRYFLQTTDQHFDLITAEPPPPLNAGVVSLYTREYFQLIHDRLTEGGMVAYWLPLNLLTDVSAKAILRAFCGVFKDCSLWHGMGTSLMMVGTRYAQGPVREEDMIRQWTDPVEAPEMRALGFERPEQLGALFIGDAEYLERLTAGSPPLIDNYPKRIEAPISSRETANRVMGSFTDVAAARERFRGSPFIKGLWPEPLQTTTLPYFDFQNMILLHWYETPSKSHPDIEKIHGLLTRSTLSTLVLWLLGSDSDAQRIVSHADPQTLASPVFQYHLGLRLISERSYAAAVAPLSQAELLPGLREDAFRLRIYALSMSGQIPRAQQLAHDQLAKLLRAKGLTEGSVKKATLPPFWTWMKRTFGIDPLKGN